MPTLPTSGLSGLTGTVLPTLIVWQLREAHSVRFGLGDQAEPVPDVDKVFLPFDEGGDTIGLPFCYRLLRAMGGALTFEQKDHVACFVMSVQRAQRGHPERATPEH